MKSISVDDLPSIALTSPGETDPLGMGQEIDFGELEAGDGLRRLHHEARYTTPRLPD